jgi:hypothetical protein
MKNKSVTYVLIGVVVLIWGVIFYRIIHAATEDSSEGSTAPTRPLVSNNVQEVEDTFELIAHYRDPFLGKTTFYSNDDQRAGLTRKKKTSAAKTILPTPAIDWSFIAYLGTIRNKQLKKEVGILRINGNETIVGVNDRVGDVTVLKITRDSATITFQNVRKVLGKSF